MSDRIIQTVTPRQLRREFNGVGLTFLVVFALAVGAAFGYQRLVPLLEPYYQTVDRQAAEAGIRIAVTLIVMLLPFQAYAAIKKMKTGRFFWALSGRVARYSRIDIDRSGTESASDFYRRNSLAGAQLVQYSVHIITADPAGKITGGHPECDPDGSRVPFLRGIYFPRRLPAQFWPDG